ncbi:hypothetical protein SeMB42_g04200 [Synchytrium endobioticum]|uniref:Disintegrin and metalloproteinase domain-containing protein B n=1 Tax=Synchytrium endobioticum TaxID=286115 RepID=A0A507D228_9FUNG|nr:hypothetical protein SeMB42_g04200 [Synchytrium endobioticum]TPX45318.1 hypothetical protein SeLEV6574_g03927 [Synchytrium endobioticum]
MDPVVLRHEAVALSIEAMFYRVFKSICLLLPCIIPSLLAADVTLLHRIRKYDFLTGVDVTLGNAASVVLSFNALDQQFTMLLQPNDMLVQQAGVVRIHGEDGDVQEHSLNDFASGRAFHGKVVEEDSRGILKEVGWARIIFHDDDLWMGRLDPDFEGVFTNRNGMYHIKHVDLYKMAKRPDDAPVMPMLDRPKHQQRSRLIIYADSQEGHVAATCSNTAFPFSTPAGCGVDSDLFANATSPLAGSSNSKLGKRDLLSSISASDEHSCGFDPSIHIRMGAEIMTEGQSRLAERAPLGCPTSRQVLGVGAAADCTYTAQYGSPSKVLTQILSDFNSASKVYENTFNVTLALVEVSIHQTCTPSNNSIMWNQACSDAYTINNRLSDFSRWRGQKSADQAGLWHLLTNCPTGPSVGIAWLGTVCETKFTSQQTNGQTQYVSGCGVSSIVPTEWKVVAHEIGHNFGAIHDCVSSQCPCAGASCACCQCSNCDCQGQYIMHPTDNSVLDAFSPCSQNTICSQFPKLGTCLKTPGFFSTVTSGICGNGIKEAGEECDCGAQCATDSCCDGATCKFKNNAKCDDLNDDCCRNCQLMSNGTVCRDSIGVCDYAEYCNGVNASCPADQHVSDGTSCDSARGLTCASGICTSRDLQCMSNNTYFTTTGACPGHESDCALWCSAGSVGCLKGAGSYLDGTPCGYGGRCYQGSCTSSNFFYELLNWFKSNPSIAIPAGVLIGIMAFGVVLGICTCCVRRWRHKQGVMGYGLPQRLRSPDSFAAGVSTYQADASNFVDPTRYNGPAYTPRDDLLMSRAYDSPSQTPLRGTPMQLAGPLVRLLAEQPLAAPAPRMQAPPRPPQRAQFVTYNRYGAES